MRDYSQELENRITFVKKILADSGASGIVFGNSGGKDCALVGIICKMACDNTTGVIMPCSSSRNYNEDKLDAELVADQFGIKTVVVDLSDVKEALVKSISTCTEPNSTALTNIPPRLRMTTLYAIAASENLLVAGTGNRSEIHMGYFTKWGDSGHDFNPISDLTVTEVYEFLRYLNAPDIIINKAPSAGLFEGQTDEMEMGISYSDIDKYLLEGTISAENKAIVDRYHSRSEHKRRMPPKYSY